MNQIIETCPTSKQSKPIIKTKIYDPNSYKFTQTRSFSTESLDPSVAIPVVSTIRSPFEPSQAIDQD